MAPRPGSAVLILYDADCGMCRVTMAGLLRWGRQRAFEPVALQSERARRLLAHMTEEERMASFHVVMPDGELLSAGAALTEILDTLPGAGVLAGASRRLPGATARAYGLVAGNRTRIGPLIPDRIRRWAQRELAVADGDADERDDQPAERHLDQ